MSKEAPRAQCVAWVGRSGVAERVDGARQIGGRIAVAKGNGGGTVWRLTFAAPARAVDAFGDTAAAPDRGGSGQPAA